MFEHLIQALKRIPRPLLPLVPMVVMLLGPNLVLLLIVYSIHVPYTEQGESWAWEARDNGTVARSAVSASSSQTPAVNQSIAGARVTAPLQLPK